MKKNILVYSFIFMPVFFYSQAGINTPTPQKTLHVNGSLQITNEFSIGGNAATSGNAGTSGQVLISKGPGAAPAWENLIIPTFPELATGTLISIDGEYMIAQEIIALMTQDATFNGVANGPTFPITYLTNEIIDNENKMSGSSTGNTFSVSETGVYQIIMNITISQTPTGTTPVVGVWNNTDSRWVARVNDYYTAPPEGRQTLTLITSIPMSTGKIYSFRVTNTETFTVRAFSSGTTGSGPVSFVSVKRLK